MKPEMFLQCEFARWLDSKRILYCASAGGMRTNIRTAVNMKRSGYKKGFPDVFLYQKSGDNKYAGLAIELKAGKNPKTTPEQLAWKAALISNGYQSVIMPRGLNFNEGFNWLRGVVENYLVNNLKES
jgi:hypothetical protein